jgi:hypothetical protein
VLLAGGFSNNVIPNVTMASTDLYNPGTNTFAASGSLATAKLGHAAVLLTSGKVLVAGGGSLASAELFDPSSKLWTAAVSMANARSYFTAALLDSGAVLVAGGQAPTVPGTLMTSAEVYW